MQRGTDAFRKVRPDEGTVEAGGHYAPASKVSSPKSSFIQRAGTVIDYFTGYQLIGQIWTGVRNRSIFSSPLESHGAVKGASSAYSLSLTILEAQLLVFGSPYAGDAVRLIETIARPGGKGLLYALDKSTRAD